MNNLAKYKENEVESQMSTRNDPKSDPNENQKIPRRRTGLVNVNSNYQQLISSRLAKGKACQSSSPHQINDDPSHSESYSFTSDVTNNTSSPENFKFMHNDDATFHLSHSKSNSMNSYPDDSDNLPLYQHYNHKKAVEKLSSNKTFNRRLYMSDDVNDRSSSGEESENLLQRTLGDDKNYATDNNFDNINNDYNENHPCDEDQSTLNGCDTPLVTDVFLSPDELPPSLQETRYVAPDEEYSADYIIKNRDYSDRGRNIFDEKFEAREDKVQSIQRYIESISRMKEDMEDDSGVVLENRLFVENERRRKLMRRRQTWTAPCYSSGSMYRRSYSSEQNGEVQCGGRLRMPSVVISDHSEDSSMASWSLTLEEIERLQCRHDRKSSFGSTFDSASECSLSSWSNANSCISYLDNDYDIAEYCGQNPCECSGCCCSSAESCVANDPVVASSQPATIKKASGWRKLRNIVQWTPFFQTYKKQRYPWVQLAGHQGNFKAGPEPATILKKLCPKEQMCFQVLMKDPLKPFVPQYKGYITTDDGELYLQLQDLLSEFSSPCVMDCKMGVRTYLEEELAKAKEKPKLRKDMYEKMIQIDPNAPSEEEHRLKGVTKPRYMVWRETISSTATLGFRIEGIRKSDGKSSKDFKTTKTKDQVAHAFQHFVSEFPFAVEKYVERLHEIKRTLMISKFFATHEVIGSSLLFVHDDKCANIWMIDFAKTVILPSDVKIDHVSEWIVGNHEDGYLIGLDNLIHIFTSMLPDTSTLTDLT